MDTFLREDPAARKRRLRVFAYTIVPLSPDSGVGGGHDALRVLPHRSGLGQGGRPPTLLPEGLVRGMAFDWLFFLVI